MTLKRQLLLGFLSVLAASGFGIAATLWWVGAGGMHEVGRTSAAALQERAQGQLATLRGVKSAQVADLMELVADQLAVYAGDRTAIDASLAFAYDVDLVRHESETPQDALAALRPALTEAVAGPAFLGWNAFSRHAAAAPGYAPRPAADYVPADPNAQLLWEHYIRRNPAAPGERQKLDEPADLVCGYVDNHLKFHPAFRDFAERFGYADVLLLAPDTGRVLYSVRKNLDFARRITDGPFAKTGLAAVFRAADASGKAGRAGEVAHSDFAPYEPAGNAPRAFLATPVFDGGKGGKYAAVLAFSLPAAKLNSLMLSGGRFEAFGLGKTGETYLVGPDGLLRTSLRSSPDELDVLRDRVNTDAVRAALEGNTGQALTTDPRGRAVLAAWQPVQVLGTRWALVAQMESAEALAASAEVERMTSATGTRMAGAAVIALGVFLAAACAVAFRIVARVMTPIDRLGAYAESVAGGDFNAAIDGSFPAELDALRGSIRNMVARLKDRLGFAQGILDAISRTFPCMTLDNAGRITFVGQILLDLAGKPGKPADYHGQRVGEFFFGDANRRTRSDEALETRTRVEGEMTVAGDGGEHILQVNANPVFDLDNNQTGAFTLYFDLTTIRRQEADIRAKNEKIAAVAAQAVGIAREVAASAGVLATQVEDAANGARMQSARATETAAAMDEMNAASADVARNASEAADSAAEARTRATEGAGSVTRLVDAIGAIRGRTEELESFMGDLGQRTDAVGNVLGVISDIADQTNLLALNAAIEAARAGDAGRGFAVVADEVRKLAEKTMQATHEGGNAIRAIQDGAARSIDGARQAGEAVRESVGLARESGDTLDRIVTIVTGTADRVGSIATAAEQQSAASEQVGRAVGEVNQVAARTADGMERAEAAISDLAAQAEELQRLISALREG